MTVELYYPLRSTGALSIGFDGTTTATNRRRLTPKPDKRDRPTGSRITAPPRSVADTSMTFRLELNAHGKREPSWQIYPTRKQLRRDVVPARRALRAVSEQVSDLSPRSRRHDRRAQEDSSQARSAAFRRTGRMDGVRSGKARWTGFSGSPVTRK
jgi:hypothetical protein